MKHSSSCLIYYIIVLFVLTFECFAFLSSLFAVARQESLEETRG